MAVMVVPAPVRATLGADASEGLVEMFGLYQEFATDRFERRLTEDVSALRLDVGTELREALTGIRVEMANIRTDMVKWCLLF